MPHKKKVTEGWTGPGRRDSIIEPLKPVDDALHMDRRGVYEWWYFDAHLDNGYTIVIFFHASNPNPGLEGKTGMEIVMLRPEGVRVQKFIPHKKSEFSAARDKPEVTIGQNTLRVQQRDGDDELPVYEIDVREQELGCHLTYRAEVNGWKPGTGLSHFGDLGFFGWVIPFARASVEGTITDGDKTFQVKGIGYHDHNWLNFPFATIIEYWMWGRIYSENFTVSYAFIQCNEKVNRHMVKVLMLAEGSEVVLSTGEFDFLKDDFEYNPKAKYHFPKQIIIHVPDGLKATLKMKRILEAQDMLENFRPVLRFLAKNILRVQPGYFRLLSDFELKVSRDEGPVKETGETLHEIVLFKPVK